MVCHCHGPERVRGDVTSASTTSITYWTSLQKPDAVRWLAASGGTCDKTAESSDGRGRRRRDARARR